MKILLSSSFWFFCFTILFLLALDFWSWQEDITIGFWHLPVWIFYFIGLQTSLAIALLIFTQQFWTND